MFSTNKLLTSIVFVLIYSNNYIIGYNDESDTIHSGITYSPLCTIPYGSYCYPSPVYPPSLNPRLK